MLQKVIKQVQKVTGSVFAGPVTFIINYMHLLSGSYSSRMYCTPYFHDHMAKIAWNPNFCG